MITELQINKNMEDYKEEKDSLRYDEDEHSISSIVNALDGGDWYKNNPKQLIENIDTTTSSKPMETGKKVLDWINPKSYNNKDNWRKTKEDVKLTARDKNAENMAWLKTAAQDSIKTTGAPPSSEMQALINADKKNAVKDWQKSEIDRYAKEKEYLQMKSAGTSMGSGKLPIGNNVKKSGSQIGKHMNKYGV